MPRSFSEGQHSNNKLFELLSFNTHTHRTAGRHSLCHSLLRRYHGGGIRKHYRYIVPDLVRTFVSKRTRSDVPGAQIGES